ncbi:hypothetical protein FPV67DRAFT_1130793 [Lyophyllum atratum]|nr:hypothetical protein FPV67DRAFT_1130793 [Lyophyllum atratum]
MASFLNDHHGRLIAGAIDCAGLVRSRGLAGGWCLLFSKILVLEEMFMLRHDPSESFRLPWALWLWSREHLGMYKGGFQEILARYTRLCRKRLHTIQTAPKSRASDLFAQRPTANCLVWPYSFMDHLLQVISPHRWSAIRSTGTSFWVVLFPGGTDVCLSYAVASIYGRDNRLPICMLIDMYAVPDLFHLCCFFHWVGIETHGLPS